VHVIAHALAAHGVGAEPEGLQSLLIGLSQPVEDSSVFHGFSRAGIRDPQSYVCARAGRRTAKVLPLPGTLSTVTRP